jgi:SOS-response transcriptional repressor LexA
MNQIRSAPSLSFAPKQGQYLAFIYAYTQVLGRAPAEADLQRFFRVTPPSVHQMILALERDGFIRRQPGAARSIQILVEPEALPVLRQPVKTPTSQNLCVELLVQIEERGVPVDVVPWLEPDVFVGENRRRALAASFQGSIVGNCAPSPRSRGLRHLAIALPGRRIANPR